jgi:DNA-binding transcriptional LysR family regulator
MNLARINLNLIVILDILLQEKHITRTSQRLNLTQSTISTALKQLRELFHDELLIREKNKMVLTIKAQKLAPQIKSILSQLQGQVFSEVDFNPQTTERTFVIAVNDYFECILMTELMPQLIKNAPYISIVTQNSNNISNHLFEHPHGIDLAIGVLNLTRPHIRVQQLYTESLVCAGSANHPIFEKPITMKTYLQAKHLNLVNSDGISHQIDSVLQQMGHFRSVTTTVSHLSTALYLLANSHLLATLPITVVNKAKFINLVSQPLPYFIPEIKVFQAWHPQYDNDNGHRWLRQFVKQTIDTVICREAN